MAVALGKIFIGKRYSGGWLLPPNPQRFTVSKGGISMNANIATFLPEALLIDVPEVDEQHANLFASLAHLKDRCIELNCLPPDDAAQLLEALTVHCATEESLAKHAGLDFAVHAKKHSEMLKGIGKTVNEVQQGRMDVFSLIRYIEYWFERHITEEDKPLGLSLKNVSRSGAGR
jgi:hemerythrin-like metal-binding protein